MRTISNLQILRAVAAGMVVLHHVRDLVDHAYPWVKSIHVGAAGVDVFFVLSGVVISLAETGRSGAPGAFLMRRVIRVVPMYWIALFLIAIALTAGLSPVGVHPSDGNIENLLKSMFFVPFERWHGAVMPLLGVGWTLNYEMFFYVIFAVFIFLPATGRATALVAVMCLLTLAGLLFRPSGVIAAFYTNPILLEFAAGVVLAQLWVRESMKSRHDGIAGIALLVVGVALFVVMARPDGFEQLAPARVLFFGIPAVLCVAGAMLMERAGLRSENRLLLLLGAASYVLYLFHAFVLQFLEKALGALSLHDLTGVPLLALVVIAVVLCHVIGVVIHKRVEMPVTAALRRSSGQKRPLVSEKLRGK